MNAILFTICTLIWGSTWIAINFQIDAVAPIVAVAWRFTIAAMCLGAWCLLTKRSFAVPLSVHKRAALAGLFLYCMDYTFLYAAQQYIVSALLAVLSSSVIYFTVLLRWLCLKKPIRIEVVVGASFGLVGIFLIFWPEFANMTAQQGLALGLLFALGSFLSASVGNILSESILDKGTPVVQMNFYAMSYALVFLYGSALLSGTSFTPPSQPDFYIALLYLAIFGSVFAFGAYMTLLKRIGSDKSTYVVLLYPIVALVISTVFESYKWTAYAIAGVVIVMLGNAIAMNKLPLRFARTR